MSDAHDWSEIQAIFNEALDATPAERDRLLNERCDGRPAVRAEVESLLASHDEAGGLLDAPVTEVGRALTGLRVGAFRLVEEIGRGGMSVVYLGERVDGDFDQKVAVKILDAPLGTADVLQRFRAERQILAELEHPNIARLLDGGTTGDGTPYLVMEYVDGVMIDRFAAAHRLSRTERLRLFLQVCDAVQYAHRKLVVHRDLKPANILVSSDGRPRLLDFGIAKLLARDARAPAATLRALTPEYASPEQALGRTVGTATDVYSLGVLLFVLLADRLPYPVDAAGGPATLMRAICDEPPMWQPGGLIQGDLRSILGRALDKEPDRRYLSVADFAEDLRRYLAGLPVAARPDSLAYRARQFVIRHPLPVITAAALVVAIAAGAVSTLVQWRRAERRFNDVRTLAHSFLFDVYDAISTVPGTLPARRLVASRAQLYLDSLAGEAANDAGLERELAESYMRLGDVRGGPYAANLGDTPGALDSYRRALTLLASAQRRDPDDVATAERLAEAHKNIGRVLTRQRDLAAAIEELTRAADEMTAVCARAPNNLQYRVEMSHAFAALAEAQHIAGQQTGSLDRFHQTLATSLKSLDILESAGPHTEEFWQYGLASRHFRVGYALTELGDRTGDLSYYRRALDTQLQGDAVMRALAQAHPERHRDRELADDLMEIGQSRWKCCQDLDGSVRDLGGALELFERLAAEDPRNIEARRDVGNASLKLSAVLVEGGRRDTVLTYAARAVAVFEECDRADPSNRDSAESLKAARDRLASIQRAR